MRMTTGLVLVAALTGVSCRTNTEVVVLDPAPGAARLRAGEPLGEEVARLVQPLIESGEDRGVIVGVLQPDGTVRSFTFGTSGAPADPASLAGDTLFQVGSLTKVLVTALLAVLFEEGTLKPGDTVREILPAGVELSPDAGALTLLELATHTSGLPREPTDGATLLYAIDYMFTGHNLYRYLTRDRAYAALRNCTLPPRSERRAEYSNLATGLLAHLIEVRTGRSLPDLLAEKITGPLGMRDTTFFPDDGQKRRLAQGHAGGHPCFLPRDTPMPPWDMGDFMRGCGGLYSTLDDLMTFAQANLAPEPHALTPLLRDLHRPRSHAAREDYSLGWIVHTFDEGRIHITYKYGIVSGYSAYIGMNVEKRLAVVVLCNSFHWDDKVGHNLLLRLTGAMEEAAGGVAATAR